MRSAPINPATIVLLLTAVVLLFFIHVPAGGFQATQGPHSTLQEQDSLWKMLAMMFLAVAGALQIVLVSLPQSQIRTSLSNLPGLPVFANSPSALRC